jgi:hypothetical protein
MAGRARWQAIFSLTFGVFWTVAAIRLRSGPEREAVLSYLYAASGVGFLFMSYVHWARARRYARWRAWV